MLSLYDAGKPLLILCGARMTRKFDLVVIGTGSAASTVTSRCRSAGWQVAIVDYRPFGGTCALRGCDPKKVLVGAAEVIDRALRMNLNCFSSHNLPAREDEDREADLR